MRCLACSCFVEGMNLNEKEKETVGEKEKEGKKRENEREERSSECDGTDIDCRTKFGNRKNEESHLCLSATNIKVVEGKEKVKE